MWDTRDRNCLRKSHICRDQIDKPRILFITKSATRTFNKTVSSSYTFYYFSCADDVYDMTDVAGGTCLIFYSFKRTKTVLLKNTTRWNYVLSKIRHLGTKRFRRLIFRKISVYCCIEKNVLVF